MQIMSLSAMNFSSIVPDGLVGGMLIGLSAGTLLLGNGKILGASGIVRSILQQSPKRTLFVSSSSNGWKVHFLAAFSLVSDLYQRYSANSSGSASNGVTNTFAGVEYAVSATGFAVAGFLVGLGTTMGNGCTSGHGICGLARFSKRSLAAVVSFMGAGVLTASVCDPGCPLAPLLREILKMDAKDRQETATTLSKWICTLVTGVLVAASGFDAICRPSCGPRTTNENAQNHLKTTIISWLSGGLFSLGLAMSGMVESRHIVGFLDAKGISNGTWDPTLVFVMVGGLLVSAMSYQFVPGYNLFTKPIPTLDAPWSSSSFQVPSNTIIDRKLLLGAAIFGLGWGIGGICPGPAVYLAATGNASVLFKWWPCFWIGSLLAPYIPVN